MNKNAKIYELEDVDGFKLPKNVSTQFRELQGGIEHLKYAADTIISELQKKVDTESLNGVDKKLSKNTTDLSLITDKVNSIDSTLKKHMKNTSASLKNIQELNTTILSLLENIFKAMSDHNERISRLEKPNG